MPDRADQSLLPGAPHPQSERPPKGVHAIDLAGSRLGHVPVELDKLWDPDECPEELLPWLAWSLSVDEWDPNASVAEKRAAIKASPAIHRKKGTVMAVRQTLDAGGYADDELKEGYPGIRRDGTFRHDGLVKHNSEGAWAFYAVIIDPPDGAGEAPEVDDAFVRVLVAAAPVRSKFLGFTYRDSAIFVPSP